MCAIVDVYISTQEKGDYHVHIFIDKVNRIKSKPSATTGVCPSITTRIIIRMLCSDEMKRAGIKCM